MDLQNKHTKVTGVATQGRNYNNLWSGPHHQWVTSYKLDYSDNGVSFLYYKEDGKATDKVRTEKKIYQALNKTQTEKISQIINTCHSIQVEEYSREQYVYLIDQARGQDGWILAEFSFLRKLKT